MFVIKSSEGDTLLVTFAAQSQLAPQVGLSFLLRVSSICILSRDEDLSAGSQIRQRSADLTT